MPLPGRGSHQQSGYTAAHKVQVVPVIGDTAWLTDDNRIGVEVHGTNDVLCAILCAVFFVCREEQTKPPSQWRVLQQALSGDEHGGHGTLHVSRSEPVETITVDGRGEGVNAPDGIADGFGVDVPIEHQVAASCAEVDSGEKVGAVILAADHAGCGQAELVLHVHHDRCNLALIAG